ncbi:hypothetical protein QTG54_008334 [Skeletonema marinoi]|uniref:Uncharacterized protein n=1 Tax=Skeletonema marinoi TaxID=267567 RepID=A0AAD8Y8T9_9STRA|nr:hypothetical protein QTG54_008334 [Skeletonema marinoi]
MTSEQPPPPPHRSDHLHLLEGTLLHRSQKSNIYKKNIRMYTIFDMSGSAGASLEVGGIGSLQCYRFVNLKSKKEGDLAYSSTRFGNKGGDSNDTMIGSGVKRRED